MICLMNMIQKIPSRHLPVQDVAGRPSLAEDVNVNRYCGSMERITVYGYLAWVATLTIVMVRRETSLQSASPS
jgi:uncharacterized protein with NAD-binding domain and iron-sulfur cluster